MLDQLYHTIPARSVFLQRATAMIPTLQARAAETELNRRVSDETAAELRAAQFHRMMAPPEFGGFGYGMDVATEVIAALSSGCGSTGWVANLFMLHSWQVSLFSLQAQQEYWADSQDTLSSTASFAMKSQMEPAPGGFRVSGRWKFSSGADFADWFIIMKPSPTCLDWALVPRRDVTIIDDWFVSGLCGTGSKDIVLDNVFVPEHRMLSIMQLMAGTTPGGQHHRLPLATLPFPLPATWGVPSAIIGMAKGMADAVQKSLVGKRALFTGELQVERVANQMKLAEAYTEINAATCIMRNRLTKLAEWERDGTVPQGAEMHASQCDAAYVGRMMAKTANTLSQAAGASATYVTSPVQRFLRDILSAATHVSVAWEDSAENYGRALWGLPQKGAA